MTVYDYSSILRCTAEEYERDKAFVQERQQQLEDSGFAVTFDDEAMVISITREEQDWAPA